jgi:hypothetical protein
MNRRFATYAPQIARRFDWSRFSRVVDVGGGDGTLLTEILLANPGLHGHVVDLPATAVAATRRFAEAGLGDRATATAGSFFDPLPAGADAYVLSDILHNWGDEGARAILAGCAEAAEPDGVVLVIEIMRSPPGPHTAFELSMAVFFGGRERTPAEVAALGPRPDARRHDHGGRQPSTAGVPPLLALYQRGGTKCGSRTTCCRSS